MAKLDSFTRGFLVRPFGVSRAKRAGVPRAATPEFQERFYDLNQSLYDTSPLVGQIMRDIDDDEIVYQKGEGAELVTQDNGSLVPWRGTILMCKYFVARRVELVKQSTTNLADKTLLDVGASSDLIFRYLDKTGTGLNISQSTVEYMNSKGIEAVQGDAHELPYPDKSFDYVLCYETLEHLENPLKALRELSRVAREKVFITIPYVKKTTVCSFEPKDREPHRWHLIEFCMNDFQKLLPRAGLRLLDSHVMRTAGKPRNLGQIWFAVRHYRRTWAPGFSYFELEPLPQQ